MKPRNIVPYIVGIAALASFSVAYAAPGDWLIEKRNPDDTEFINVSAPTKVTSTDALLGSPAGTDNPAWYYLSNFFTVSATSTPLGVKPMITLNTGTWSIYDTNDGFDILAGKASTSSVAAVQSSVNSINATMAEIAGNLYGTSTSMLASSASTTNAGLLSKAQVAKLNALSTSTASSTAAGLMSSADKTKLDGLSAPVARSFATSSRSIVTGTGATGFQVSASRDSTVNYAVNIATTATIGGASDGYVTLEIAPTNSATAGDWYEVGSRCRNGQAITLAVALQSVQNVGCNLTASVPAGYYAKLRSVNVSGTPTYTYVSGQEVLL